jgi:hypothetical protein
MAGDLAIGKNVDIWDFMSLDFMWACKVPTFILIVGPSRLECCIIDGV